MLMNKILIIINGYKKTYYFINFISSFSYDSKTVYK
jgi:hypothetical protein